MMNVNAAEYSPGGPPPPSGNNNSYAPHHQQPQHHHHPHNNNMHPRHNNHNNGPRGHQMSHEHHHGMHHQQHFVPQHHNQNFSRQPQHHQHHLNNQPQVIMREAILVLDGVPPRRAETAAVIAQWWRCPSIVDTVTPPKEDDESNPAAALQLALESYPDVGRFVIAGFLWNHPHEIHHLGAVLKSKNIILAAVIFVDTDPADLNPNSFQIHDKPAHPLYCEVATMYFNEKNNFFLTTDDLITKFKPGGGNMLKFVDDLQPTPHKPWSSDLRMTDYETVQDIRAAIRALLGNELSHKFPTHFLTYPLFSRYHETISKKCMVTYDFEGDRGHLVRFNNKDYLIFGTGMVYTATNSYRAPGADAAGITFIFEVHSAKKKDPPRRKESDDVSDSSHFFVTDVVYWKGTRYDAAPYNERQEVIRDAFKNPVGTKWRPAPTVEVSKYNWKSEVDFEIAGYQFYEMGGNNRVFLFKIMETSTANLRLWGGGSQDEKTYCWTFQGNMLGSDEAEIEMPNTDIVVASEIVDQEKVHFGTIVRARMERPSRQAGPGQGPGKKLIWRVVDRNWTTNYPTGITRTSSPWTVEGLFNALLTLNSK